MGQKRITQRLIYVLEVEFNMRDAISIPSKNPKDITIGFFQDDVEHRLVISKYLKRGKKR